MYSGMKIYFLSQISSLKQILPVLKTSEVAKQFPWFPFSKTCSLCKLGESQAHSLVAPAPEYLVEHLASFPSEKPWSPLQGLQFHTSPRVSLNRLLGWIQTGSSRISVWATFQDPEQKFLQKQWWMPSGSRDLFTFSCYSGLKHPTGLALLRLITLTCVLQKTFRAGISPRFSLRRQHRALRPAATLVGSHQLSQLPLYRVEAW